MDLPASPASDALILVVEDTPASLELLTYLLQHAGFRTHGAASGEEALQQARALLPDAILLDVQLPDIDGYAVCRRLKQAPELADIPVLFLSAHQDSEAKVMGLRAGGVDFICKPFEFEEVHARVTLQVQLRRLQHQLAWQNANLKARVEAKAQALAEAEVSLRLERERREQAERESRERLAVIAHLNRITSATVYCAAVVHELNQPLAAILANAEAGELFLDRQPAALDEIGAILHDIRRDNLRASELIVRMRDLLQRTDGTRQPLELNEAVALSVHLLGSTARMRQMELVCETSGAALPVLADRLQLQQVLINLLINAMDASAANPPGRRRVRVSVAAENGWAQAAVHDEGPGFAVLERAFEQFFTTKPEGMGLGLSIAAAIVRAHGGQIAAANRPDGGATVSFQLPLAGAAP